MSCKVETRSEKRKSQDRDDPSAVPPAQSEPGRHGPTPRSLVDGYGPQELLNSPPDCFPGFLKGEQLDVISRSFGIDRARMLLPGEAGVQVEDDDQDGQEAGAGKSSFLVFPLTWLLITNEFFL